MKIDIQIKLDPSLDERFTKYALFDAERKMADELYKALKPYIKKEVDSEHVRLTLDGIESEELGYDFKKYETRKFEVLKLEKVEHEQRND